MRWTKHIDTITAKANSKLGFIKRNINIYNRVVKDLTVLIYGSDTILHPNPRLTGLAKIRLIYLLK